MPSGLSGAADGCAVRGSLSGTAAAAADIIAPIALLLVLAAVFLRRRKRLLNVFAMLAAAALALTGFAVFRDLRVAPIRALAGETQEITATALRDAEVYDTDQRVLLSAETADGRRFRLRCYLPETEPPLLAGDRVRVMATLYVPDTLGGFDRAAYQASEGCYIAGAYATDEEHNPVKFEVLDSKGQSALRRRGSRGSAEMRCSVPFRNAKPVC